MTYRNKKNGYLYIIECSAIDVTNNRSGEMVYVYYPISDPTAKYVREVSEFLEKFEYVELRKKE